MHQQKKYIEGVKISGDTLRITTIVSGDIWIKKWKVLTKDRDAVEIGYKQLWLEAIFEELKKSS